MIHRLQVPWLAPSSANFVYMMCGGVLLSDMEVRRKTLKWGRLCAVVNELATHQRLETAARCVARRVASD